MRVRRPAQAAALKRLVEAPPPAPHVGPAIRARRRRLGMTLQMLAEQARLSAAFISQLERGLATPSITSLMGIAAALGVTLDYFMRVPREGQIVRRGDTPEMLDIGSPVEYRRLSGHHAERKLEALLMAVPPGLGAPTTRRDGEGFWYVLDGDLEMTVGVERFRLTAGDSAHFDQRHPYTMSNVGGRLLRLLWVGTPAIF